MVACGPPKWQEFQTEVVGSSPISIEVYFSLIFLGEKKVF